MRPANQFMFLSSVLMLVLSPLTARAASESLYPDTVTPAARPSDAPNWELGTIFRASLAGKITHVRAFSLAEESGDHEVRIWRNADNSLIAGPITWSFGGEEAWINLDIPDVSIQANQDYTISVTATADGWYPINGSYFGNAGNNGQNLSYPQGAGVYSDTAGTRPTNSFNNSAYLRDILFEPDLSGTIMRVKGNGTDIVDGATDPSVVNATVIGGKGVNSGTRDQTYTILNLGLAPLELTGDPKVAISGAQASDFVVTAQPAATVAPGGNTSFTLRFDPSAIGLRTATVSIPHADSSANPYDFAIQAAGLGGGAGVLGNDGEGGIGREIDGNQIAGNRFVAPHDMTISELHAKVQELSGTFKCAVYSDTNGVADRLLRNSAEVINATNGWNTFPLTAPVDVTGGNYYWLVIWSDTPGARVQLDLAGTAYRGDYTYQDLGGQFPDPIDLTTAQFQRTYCIYGEGTPLGASPGPEMDLKGSGKLIVSGDATPSVLDGTDFGNLNVASGSQDRTFTIESRGDAALDLTGNPRVSITGPHAADFVVGSTPNSPVPPAGSATFTLRFDPSSRGLRTAQVSLASNDADENPYEFAVQGAGFTTGQESIWPDTKVGSDSSAEGTYYELGTIFQTGIPGKITHLRVYSLATETGDHTARIWRNADETVIGGPYTWNYGGAAGWITFDIPDLDIEANTEYTVSVSTGGGGRNYPFIGADVPTGGNNGQNLSYPPSAGVFTTIADERPTQSFNSANYLRDVIFVPAGATLDRPDMDIKGNNTSIADGDASASSADGTDFGQTTVGGGSVERTFTIANVGTAPLNLNGTPKVTITGSQASDFSVILQPVAAPIAPSGTSSFTIRFAPTAIGARNATVSIQNDSNENPYDFAIAGAGASAAVQLRIVEIKPDLTAGSITLRWEGGDPQFQVEKATTVSGPYQPFGAAQTERVFTEAGALKAGVLSFYRIRQVSTTPEPALCITTPAPGTWVNTPFTNQTATFEVQFDATPSLAAIDSVMALSSGPGAAFTDFACLARFNPDGNIDARNAGVYAADNVIPYSANVKYSFRLVVNVPAHTYSVYVTPAGGTEQTVGTDFAFRSDQSTVANLDNWGVIVAGPAGTNTACNFKLVPVVAPAACSTAVADSVWVNNPLPDQTGTFTVQFDATPSADLIDSVMALSSGPGAAFPDFACLTRFFTDGFIEARNGADYAPLPGVIPYSANVKYSFRLVINIPAHTYSIYVTPAGGTEQTVGTDFAFRSEQSTVANLDNWGVIVTSAGTAGTNTVCNFKLVP